MRTELGFELDSWSDLQRLMKRVDQAVREEGVIVELECIAFYRFRVMVAVFAVYEGRQALCGILNERVSWLRHFPPYSLAKYWIVSDEYVYVPSGFAEERKRILEGQFPQEVESMFTKIERERQARFPRKKPEKLAKKNLFRQWSF